MKRASKNTKQIWNEAINQKQHWDKAINFGVGSCSTDFGDEFSAVINDVRTTNKINKIIDVKVFGSITHTHTHTHI